jgi:hypothetical protein
MEQSSTMNAVTRKRLITQRAIAKASLTRFHKFIGSGDIKVNELQVRYEELPNTFIKFETAQTELEFLMMLIIQVIGKCLKLYTMM